eukprot:Lithocolla_globosa_v1_NODE_4986_length_1324_cov_201.917192.p1 type:complete len:199 gc:universal NODE_4986_length_1324_cov_201.917192:929-333(-)
MAIEQNMTHVNNLMADYQAGRLSYLVPFVYSNKQSLGTGNVTLSIRYSRAHGEKLRKILVAPFNDTESANTVLDHSNVTEVGVIGNIISNYYSMMNNVRNSQFNYDVTAGQDYLDKKHLTQGSCIQSSNEFYYNYVIQESFVADLPIGVSRDNMDDGLPLDLEQKYDLVLTTNADKVYLVFAVLQKRINVSPTGVILG